MKVSTESNKQPKVFYLMSGTSLFERLSYYILTMGLVLAAQQLFQFSENNAMTLVALFSAISYLIPAIGGYLSDRYFGIKNTMILGFSFETVGYLITAISGTLLLQHHSVNLVHTIFFIGLSFIVVGSGLFKTGPTNVIGRCYTDKNDPRLDGGFTLFYMIINLGAIASGIIASFGQNAYTWAVVFYVAAIFSLIGVLWLFFKQHWVEKHMESQAGQKPFQLMLAVKLSAAALVAIGLFSMIFAMPSIGNILFATISLAVILYLIFEIIKSPRHEGLRILVALILISVAFVFFVIYNQIFMSLPMFVNNMVDRSILGVKIPTLIISSDLDPIWVVILSAPMAWLYKKLHEKGKDPHITVKFSLGLMFSGIGYLFIATSKYFHDANYNVSLWWVVIGIGIFAVGELLISALGVSMVTKIVPNRLYGFMMGAWYLIAISFASILAGDVSKLTIVPSHLGRAMMLHAYTTVFFWLGVAGVVAGIFTYLISFKLKRILALVEEK